MPHDEADPQDPMELVGVEVPGSEESVRELAWAVAEEFARMGHSEARLLAMFSNPFFAAAHRARCVLGQAEVTGIVREACRAWGALRTRIVDAPHDPPSNEVTP
jgi:hypothetical protein